METTSISGTELEYVPVASVDELPNGERLFMEIDGQPIVIFNLGGLYYAIGDLCSHDDGPVGEGMVDGEEIICPRHGARFDLRTGKALRMPAVKGIPAYPVRVVDGKIEIGLPPQS